MHPVLLHKLLVPLKGRELLPISLCSSSACPDLPCLLLLGHLQALRLSF